MSDVVETEYARLAVRNTVFGAMKKYAVTPGEMSGILSGTLAEVRELEKTEIIQILGEKLKNKDDELEKAKKEAKKVLEANPPEDTKNE